jgi:assimilatory nitrate reductase catalytic subunit
VKDYNLEWAERVTGISKEKIMLAAEWWGKAKTSFLMHARGIEHHSKGVENVIACINLVLATGRIGKPFCGYGPLPVRGMVRAGANMVISATSFQATVTSRTPSTGVT